MAFTFAGMVCDLAGKYSDSTAFALDGQNWSFGDLQERGTRLARVLRMLGVRRADRVGFLGKNSPAFFELTMACSLLDAVVVGLNWRLSTMERAVIISDASLSLIVASTELAASLRDTHSATESLRVITTGIELDELIAAADSAPFACESGPDKIGRAHV